LQLGRRSRSEHRLSRNATVPTAEGTAAALRHASPNRDDSHDCMPGRSSSSERRKTFRRGRSMPCHRGGPPALLSFGSNDHPCGRTGNLRRYSLQLHARDSPALSSSRSKRYGSPLDLRSRIVFNIWVDSRPVAAAARHSPTVRRIFCSTPCSFGAQAAAEHRGRAHPTPNRSRPVSAAIKANLIPPLQRQQLAGNPRNSCRERHVNCENEHARAIVYVAVKNCARSPQQATQRATIEIGPSPHFPASIQERSYHGRATIWANFWLILAIIRGNGWSWCFSDRTSPFVEEAAGSNALGGFRD
jgi:hypothetical protein